MSRLKEAADELLARETAFTSMAAFRTYMARTDSVDFEHAPAAHHELIMRELERLESGEVRKVMILAPPGSAKSTYGSVQFPLWYLAKHPREGILCCSNTDGFAETLNRRRRNVAYTQEWQNIAATSVSDDLQGVSMWGVKAQGWIRAAGVGATIVGVRSHLAVLDDPISSQDEAYSATALDKQWEWYLAEYRTRMRPDAKEVLISTRWARRDIAGRLLELIAQGVETGWSIVRLPMVADSDDDPLGRAIGEPLWAEYFHPQFIAEKQRDAFVWATQFQQTPLDEAGSWVTPEHLRAESYVPESLQYVIAVDLALSVGRGDYTAIVVAGLDANRHLHIVHVERERISSEVIVQRLAALSEIYMPQEVLIDDDNASKVFVRLMGEIMARDRRPFPPLNPQPLRGRDKETRASAIRGLFLAGRVHILAAPWTAALTRELVEFPAGEHDDQVDALSLIGRRFPLLGSPLAAASAAPDPYAGQMIRPGPDGRFYYAATLDQMFSDREDGHARSHRWQ